MGESYGLTVNGKFLAGQKTGVYRTAFEMVRELGRRAESVAAQFGGPSRILAPRTAERGHDFGGLEMHTQSVLTGQPWEHLELPARLGGETLLSLCNLGPVMHSNAITMIHDAQTFISPDSYSYAFGRFYRTVQPMIGRRHRLILTVSDFSARQLAHYGIAPPDKIRVVHNGVDHIQAVVADNRIVQRLNLYAAPFVLALASSQAHKNIGVLLKAFASPSLQAMRLVLFGSTSRTEMENAGHTVPPKVIFTGRVSDGEIRALMEAALCFAMPSLTEGFGLPPLEAMLLGCPAIIAPCGALPEVCGDAAIGAAPSAPQQWVEAISMLSTDAETRLRRSAAGKVHASRFTWTRSVDTLLETISTPGGKMYPRFRTY